MFPSLHLNLTTLSPLQSFIPSKSPLSQVQSSQETDTQQVEKARTTKTDNPPAKVSEPESNTQKPYEVPEEQRSRIAEAAGVGGTAVGAGSAATQSQEAQAQTRNQPRNETAGAGVAGGAIGANGLSKDDREHKQAKLTSQETQQKTREETQSHTREVTDEEGVKHTHNAGAGTGDTDYRPAKMYPAHTGERADQGRAQPTSPVSPTSATTASANGSPKERRVSFLHKVRGEVKIIAGKVSGNEGKVEEGKRIIHGEL
ncbi:hypothetical protein K503DRAFT_231903 [Rhizopogon vinicolor AM-OR11-026]|uniref:Uncharacterized protein n=1 Tax=Rhizopogon vinicolor AM-OR11-026 TaxID=1314800 RepID=A0A1B7MXZ1_9AGAM|nr:hypothetical protein K503DRAFT_231903 [Rhizopogon vinicolor AM-OR11-026]